MRRPVPLVYVANNPKSTQIGRRIALEVEHQSGRPLEETLSLGDEVGAVLYPDDGPLFEEVYVVEDWFGSFELTYVGVRKP